MHDVKTENVDTVVIIVSKTGVSFSFGMDLSPIDKLQLLWSALPAIKAQTLKIVTLIAQTLSLV